MRDNDYPDMPIVEVDQGTIAAAYRVIIGNDPNPGDLLAALGMNQ